MARKTRRPAATSQTDLSVVTTACPGCGREMTIDYYNHRTLTTLQGVVRFRLQIRRCHHFACLLYRRPFRPEAEGRLALPHHEFGLDVVALVGALRYLEHRSVPEIHRCLRSRGLALAERTVTNLLDRYDELRALTVADLQRRAPLFRSQGRVILALDGLQPHVGHEVLWVLRDCLSGEVLLARSLLSATQDDLAGLLGEVKRGLDELPVPISGVVSDGQHSIRKAVALALPGVPHQLCHFHYLREAALPIYEADRPAKKELKKRVRGIRKIERKVEQRDDPLAEVIQGYCAAVRSALTDDGRPPLDSPGLLLEERLSALAASLDRLSQRGELPRELVRLRQLLRKGLEQTAALGPEVRASLRWVRRAARLLGQAEGLSGRQVKFRLRCLLGQMRQQAARLAQQGRRDQANQLEHFVKVSQSYEPGLFHCYDVADLPRTNNEWEQFFGSYRHHERRATGRKSAAPTLVVRGQVRVVAAVATRLRVVSGAELAPSNLADWQKQRADLGRRRLARVRQRRFRRDPHAYLRDLERRFRQLGLPAWFFL
jgi:hypothetical protein